MNAFRVALAGMMLLLAACATAPGGQSPRTTTTAAIGTTVRVLDDLALAAEMQVLTPETKANVAEMLPDIERVAVGYLDATEACLVVGGVLQTDPQANGVCSKSTVGRAFGDLSSVVNTLASVTGASSTTGMQLAFAAVMLQRHLRPSSTVASGYIDVPDTSLTEFRAARVVLRQSYERLRRAVGG